VKLGSELGPASVEFLGTYSLPSQVSYFDKVKEYENLSDYQLSEEIKTIEKDINKMDMIYKHLNSRQKAYLKF